MKSKKTFIKIKLILFILLLQFKSYIQEFNDSTFVVVENMPTYNGHEFSSFIGKYLTTNLIYPQFALDNKLEGTVYIQFTVDANKKKKQINNSLREQCAINTLSFTNVTLHSLDHSGVNIIKEKRWLLITHSDLVKLNKCINDYSQL